MSRSLLRLFLALLLLSVSFPATAAAARPNILWILVDDMSANFSTYGETHIRTPHVDQLAREGTKFTHAYTTAPVCSPCRSALITGMYQTSIGAHHHRSGRGTEKIVLPAGVELVPALFKKAGYYTAIGGWPAKRSALGKTDYNFEWDSAIYDGNDWSGRGKDQPFFMQIQLPGGKLRRPAWKDQALKALGSLTSPESVELPPYYPRDSVLLDDWAQYLDTCRFTDLQVGQVVERLKEEGLYDSTVLIFLTDHGISHARGKQFLYDEGIHIPLVIRGPGVKAGLERTDLVEQIDVAATSLALAGIERPKTMQARDLLATDYAPRDAVFAARDRCDETVERLRSVRTSDFKYIRNGFPHRPHLQPNRYKDGKEIVQQLRSLHQAGQLTGLPEKLLFAPNRPAEELYDLRNDPFETRNLAGDPASATRLTELRAKLDRWIIETNDLGQRPESVAQYDSDMKVYVGPEGGKNARQQQILRSNIELMKQWAAEGK
ncbi:Arylsulfatase [Caulifigura coniformis]|uniref:Arylsulfatase n=1 Tax=Caulifigura coniformis TaxID=2527983 RepID=A0A517SIX6_9PLAN|nr:sulfatase [Caulifigura coniformis]QDT56046.1 Arylsulfatase [Caulifigura coniformis]